MSSWPVTEHIHWTYITSATLEARERLSKYYDTRDEIESDPRLSREGKAGEAQGGTEGAQCNQWVEITQPCPTERQRPAG